MDLLNMETFKVPCTIAAYAVSIGYAMKSESVEEMTSRCTQNTAIPFLRYNIEDYATRRWMDVVCTAAIIGLLLKPKMFLRCLMEFMTIFMVFTLIYESYDNATSPANNLPLCSRLIWKNRLIIFGLQYFILSSLFRLMTEKFDNNFQVFQKCWGISDNDALGMPLALFLSTMIFIIQELTVHLLVFSSATVILFYSFVILSFYSFNFVILLGRAIVSEWALLEDEKKLSSERAFQSFTTVIRNHLGAIAFASTFILPMGTVLIEKFKRRFWEAA